MSRSFTTNEATIPAGWYRVTFVDDLGNQLITDPVFNRAGARDQNYFPSVRNVASKIMSRTKDQFGNLIGTFNDETTPTDEQVDQVSEGCITDVADVIGDRVPEAFIDDAQNVAALRTALQVELDFFSDQVNTGRSIYPQLLEQYKLSLENLKSSIASDLAGDGPDLQGKSAAPYYWFPPPYVPSLEIVTGEQIYDGYATIVYPRAVKNYN